jgi:hypothetical protein
MSDFAPSNDPVAGTQAVLADVGPRLAAAEAFVVVTPGYNHSFPASFKNLIDWHDTQRQAKPIGFVSYGGLSGGLRSVEQLRQVFAELHAATPSACTGSLCLDPAGSLGHEPLPLPARYLTALVPFTVGSPASHPGRGPAWAIPPCDNPTTKGMIS